MNASNLLQISSLIRSLSLCSSVRSSVCLSVQITSKFGFKLVFYEVNVPCSWNFVYSILIIWMLQISSLIRSLSLCSSVRSSVCLSVQITSKFGFKLVFYEVNVPCSWNFVYSNLIIWNASNFLFNTVPVPLFVCPFVCLSVCLSKSRQNLDSS